MKILGYNIDSVLNFDHIATGNAPSTYTENSYQKQSWTRTLDSSVTIINYNNKNVLSHTAMSTTNKFYAKTFSSNNLFVNQNFQFECKFVLDALNSENTLFTIFQSITKYIALIVKPNSIVLNFNGKILQCAYKFAKNIDYHITVGKIDNIYHFYINGELIGTTSSDYTIGQSLDTFSGLTSGTITYYLGFYTVVSNITSGSLIGKIWDINISYGNTVKHYEGFSKYSDNLIYKVNTANSKLTTNANSYKTDDVVVDKYNIDFNSFNLDKFAISFSLMNTKNELYDLITVNNYKVNINVVLGGDPEPEVIVNEYTKSALNFENGIIDQVSTTVWNKEGTATVQNVNKIFGENSFETKVLGDSLYTSSNIITGNATPYSIEFYSLIKGSSKNASGYSEFTYPLISKNNNSGGGEQSFSIMNTMNPVIFRNSYFDPFSNVSGKFKINLNEINKHQITYDGSAIRWFINDKLELTAGTSKGLRMDASVPFTFYRHSIPSYPAYDTNTHGIIDNINIFDGIATKVRDPDPYEEFLVVDLAFDGENNSTKIIDNGTAKLTWTTSGSAKLSTDQKFDGFSSLCLDGNGDILSTPPNQNLIISNDIDFTISFEFILNDTLKINYILSKRASTEETLSQSARGGYAILVSNQISFFGWYGTSTDNIAIQLLSGIIQQNVRYKVDIVRENMQCYLYVNGILHASDTQTNEFTDANYITYIGRDKVNEHQPARDFNGYIKNFKIYKGVAVIPESSVGKIQLDFDNNVTDKYNNSTWTNNGVTFDQVNSVKGSAAYFDDRTKNIITSSSNLNFDINPFIISFDLKETEKLNGSELFSNNISPTNGAIYYANGPIGLHFGYNNKALGSMPTETYINNYYYNSLIRTNTNILIEKKK